MNHIIVNIFLLLVGFICLILGAEGLVRGGRSIGLRLGLTPLFIGLTVVAFGTSMPELVVSVGAALQGKGDISVANVVGSNIFNIAFILGLTALITPVRVYLSVIKTDIPIMIVVSVVAFWLVSEGPITKIAGFLLVSALCVYTSLAYYLAKREQRRCRVWNPGSRTCVYWILVKGHCVFHGRDSLDDTGLQIAC